ncbi:MAG TPA: FG-GAP-like repeat-containing protein [Flavobacteriaceae bacterium]|nr:FG-GAP-like repeat-containing protein [Flavobacteriaceae bacterium]
MKKITFFLTLVFCVSAIQAQDTCDSAQVITAGLYTVDAINGTEVPLPVCSPNGEGATMGEWYLYTPTENHHVIVSTDLTQNAGKDTRIQIYSGTCGALNCVGGDDDSGIVEPEGGGSSYLSIAAFEATEGISYYIAFDNKWNSSGFDFTLTEEEPIPEPLISFTQQSLATSGSGLAIADMNGDYLDDVVSISATNVNVFLQTSTDFVELNIPTDQADWTPDWSLSIGDYNADGFNDLLYAAWGGVTFMKSNGDMTFTKETYNDYVASQRSNFVDINNDGHLDAFVCHDVAPNVYYINDGSGNLIFYRGADPEGVPSGLGLYSSGGNYGSIWVDYDNDRNIDMFIAKCGGEEARRTNQMHHNLGNGSFEENASVIGLADPMQTWSSAWGDFDNDGDMDVFVGASSGTHKLMQNNNGIFTDITNVSGVNTLTATSREHVTYDFDNDGYLDIVSGGNILHNNGDMTFTLMSNVFTGTGSYGDLNNDGFIDARRGANLYLNNGNSNNWTKITTVGTNSNKNGIGARVEVYTASGVQIRDVRSGDGFEYMNTLNTHFGIGTDTAIDSIVIYWPSGVVDTIENPDINEHLVVIEGQSLAVEDETLIDLSIYPNPVKEVLTLKTSGEVVGKIATVFDLNGKKILNVKLNHNSLDVSSLAPGMYMLRVEAQGKITTRKFLKE